MAYSFTFQVIDKNTGKEADIADIALREDWARELVYCDIECFCLTQNGELILTDESGHWAYSPAGRFALNGRIIFEATEQTQEEMTQEIQELENYNRSQEVEYPKGGEG
jgi:hypothetical protein